MSRDPEEIFHAAKQIRPDRRPAFLARECGDDLDLRSRLQRMLDLSESRPHILVPPGEVPSRIGQYEIIRQLGSGGMGVVYLGRDPRLGREVALKLLGTVLPASRPAFGRLRTEAQLLASLKHPNIAVVHTFEEADGLSFFTMEYVEGESLAERIKSVSLPGRLALEVCRQVADALVAAHSTGVVHLDLKPANIMLGEGEWVKVLDFGIAELLNPSGDGEEDGRGTLPNANPGSLAASSGARPRAGTPKYMSPEQAAGLPVDHRSDIYSFGCVLYECCTGRVANEDLTKTPHGARSLDSVVRRTPTSVRKLVRECLQENPMHRPASMVEVRAALSQALAPRRTRRSALAGLVVFLVLAAVLWPVPQTCDWPEGGRLTFENWLGVPVAWPVTGVWPGPRTDRATRDGAFWAVLPTQRFELPKVAVVWGTKAGRRDILAILNWRGKHLSSWSANEDPALGKPHSDSLDWFRFYFRTSHEGRGLILAPARSHNGPTTLIRVFEQAEGKVTRRAYVWHTGHLEYFPEVDLIGEGREEQLALGWAQWLTADGRERNDLPPGQCGRSVAYAIDLDTIATGAWAGSPQDSVPSLLEPSAVDFGLLAGWSFPLDGMSGQRTSQCTDVSPFENGVTHFYCLGIDTTHTTDYRLRLERDFATTVAGVTVNDAYLHRLMDLGWSVDSVRTACDDLAQRVAWKGYEWEPAVVARED